MILTNRKFGGIIMTNTKFQKNYDVFNAFLVSGADYDGSLELPKIKTSDLLPNKLVLFSHAMARTWKDFDCWVMFYEHDVKCERLWKNPKKYLNKLKKFNGIISPDFSLFRNMPLVMQQWNTYRNRALAFWLQNNGVKVIPNIRFNDERTYDFCFDSVEKNKVVAIGTYGCIKTKIDREYFKKGLKELVTRLTPKTIIVYGAAPDSIFKPYKDKGIKIVSFDSEFSKAAKSFKNTKRQVTA